MPFGIDTAEGILGVGDLVHQDDEVASLRVIAAGPSVASAAASVPRLLARVTSPVNGRVAANPATAGGFSTCDSTKKIPVQIAIDWNDAHPLPGMTATTTIYVK